MTRYALLVGVDYTDNQYLSPLSCTKEDVSVLKSALLEKGYDENNIKAIINKPTEVVRKAIESLFAKNRQPDDVCFFYFSGHGVRNDVGDRVYLAMSDTSKDLLKASTISSDSLSEVMRDCRAQQVVIMDCCFSGKVVENILKGIISGHYAALLASSTSSQYSRAGREISPFTQYLIEGIKDFTTITELRNYILKKLKEVGEDMTPQLYTSNNGDTIPLVTPNQEEKKFNFSFKNRENEFNMICSPDYKFIIIDAAAGYGKSALLRKVEDTYLNEKKWKCCYFDFSKKYETKIEEIIESKLGTNPAQQVISWNTCLLFDAVEQLENFELEWFKNFLSLCKQGITHELKIILAGRYITKNFQLGGFKFVSLSNFDENIVLSFIKEIWDKVSTKAIPESESEKWAKDILKLSAGHPKCIGILVNELQKNNFLIKQSFKELFTEYVKPEIGKILSPLNKNIRQDIELLFIFRVFNLSTLTELKNYGLILVESNILEIMEKLAFIARPEEDKLGFHSDKIVRKLLLVNMKLFEPIVYNKSNYLAQIIYDNWINKYLPIPFGNSRILGEFFLQESIYHATQRLFDKNFQEDKLVQCVRESQAALAEKLGEDKNSLECRKRLKHILEDKEINETLKEQLNDYDKDQFVNRIFNAE